MTYTTIAAAHDALVNEFTICQAQLVAVRKKLKENWTTIYVYRNDPCSDVLRNAEIQNIEEKCDTLRKIEAKLSTKESHLADSIIDFNSHNW